MENKENEEFMEILRENTKKVLEILKDDENENKKKSIDNKEVELEK